MSDTKNIAVVFGRPVSLGQTPHRFRLVDVLTALGGAMSRYTMDPKTFKQYMKGARALEQSYLVSLGTDFIAFRDGHRQASGPAAVETLELILARRFPDINPKNRRRVAVMVIGEATNEACHTCRGTGWIFNLEGVQKECPTCATPWGSTGKRRYDDRERAEALAIKVRDLPGYSKIIGKAEEFLSLGVAAALDAARRSHGL